MEIKVEQLLAFLGEQYVVIKQLEAELRAVREELFAVRKERIEAELRGMHEGLPCAPGAA